MRTVTLAFAACLAGTPAFAAPMNGTEARLNDYFRLWETNSGVSRANVQKIYGRQTLYYGMSMSWEQVFRAKQFLVRQWPNRKYSVVPGTVRKTCAGDRCTATLILSWKVSDAGGHRGTTGATTISLDLAREDGQLKIMRENGMPVARSFCRNAGDGWNCLHQALGETGR